MMERQRARRSDAGKPRLTPRDAMALEWLAQMYGAPQDVVASLLGATIDRSYKVVERWVRARQVDTATVDAGYRWIWTPPTAASAWLGWQPPNWRPRLGTAMHVRATAEIRLAFCGSSLEGWVSERLLRHEASQDVGRRMSGQRVAHIPDGLLLLPTGQPCRIEAELSPKEIGRVESILRELGPDPVLYVVTPESRRTVVRAIHRHEQWARSAGGNAGHIKVMDLEEVRACRSQEDAWSRLSAAPAGGQITEGR